MSNQEYIKSLESLSSIQRQAVNWGENPLLVLAGPGSGKTRVLTCRIARIINETINENFRILALTFTNKAANEMRTRVFECVPGQEERLFLGTFHSFCADVLRQHGVHLGLKPNFQIYSEQSDLNALLDEAVSDLKKRSTNVTDLDKKTLPVIQRLKSQLIPPENCRGVFKDSSMGERMSLVYPAYDAMLIKYNVLDYDSLIFKVYQLFSKYPAFAKRYRTVYKYICIDEFQDTNLAQYQLITSLTGGAFKNLFIVADDDQIIYQWNGASHKRLEQFVADFKPEVIQLPLNYRCPPEVIELTNNLIKNNFLRTPDKKPLVAMQSQKGKDIVRLLHFAAFEEEALGIANDIKANHENNYGRVTVLARTRKLLEGIEQACKRVNIPAFISQRKNDFESTPFVWIHSTLRLANDKNDRKSLEAICGVFTQITGVRIDPEDVMAQASGSDLGLLQNWINKAKQYNLDETAKELIDKTHFYLGQNRDFRNYSKYTIAWFQDHDKNEDGTERYARFEEECIVWDALCQEIMQSLGKDITLEAFLQELQLHSKEPVPKSNNVLLMTIHSSKGKEFEYVYLVGLVEDELPSFQSKQKGDSSPEMEEERRNCFVAITRTIKSLTMSYADSYRGWTKRPSRFLYEMGLLHD